MQQSDRTRALENVRAGKSTCMIATDVASRGLDIAGLDYVFMYDFPPRLELVRMARPRAGAHAHARACASGLGGHRRPKTISKMTSI